MGSGYVVERPHQVSYREVDDPALGPEDVLVASREAGLCRTDVEVMTGIFTDPRWVHFPVIPGHEWSGTVDEVGADVESVRTGMMISWPMAAVAGSGKLPTVMLPAPKSTAYGWPGHAACAWKS